MYAFYAVDLPRTFAALPPLKNPEDEEYLKPLLKRVLAAYIERGRAVGAASRANGVAAFSMAVTTARDSDFISRTLCGAGSMLPPLVAISRGGHGQPKKDAEAIAAKKPVVPDRFAEKAANFKAAVEGSKLSIERDAWTKKSDEQRREAVMDQFQEQEKRLAVAKCRHWSTADLTSMAVLGAGAFGTVFLVSLKDSPSPQYFALKQMTKQRHAKKNIKKGVYNEPISQMFLLKFNRTKAVQR
eukprot:s5540_g4.t1